MNVKVRKLIKRVIKLEYDTVDDEFRAALLAEELKAYERCDKKGKEAYVKQMKQNFDILSGNKV